MADAKYRRTAPIDNALRGCAAALALLAITVLGSAPAVAIEEPAYTVIRATGQFEVREYQRYLVANTYVEGDFGVAGNEGFRRLFNYISGANRGAKKITMTAPVEQAVASAKIPMTAPVEQQLAGTRWRIAFVLPASYTLESAPQPTDERVEIAQVPPRRVAVVRYRGTWSEARYKEELAALRGYLGEQGLTASGEPVFSRYDPPFMPWFLRRNEIQVPLQEPRAP